MNEPTQIESLLASVRGEDYWQRLKAEEALRELQQPPTQPFVAALSDTNARVREIACEVLGLTGKAHVLEALLSAKADPAYQVRNAAIQAIGRIGGTQATDALVSWLRDSDFAV